MTTLKARQCYICSGWFSEKQEKARLEILRAIWGANMSYFSPRDENLAPADASVSLQDAILDGNCSAIDNCRFCVASLIQSDLGTMWEVGYALSQNIPVIFYQGDGSELSDYPELLEIENAGVARTEKELTEILKTVLNKHKVEYTRAVEEKY